MGASITTSNYNVAENETTVQNTRVTDISDLLSQKVHVSVSDIQEFNSYAELMAEYKKARTVNYEYPLPDVVNSWEMRTATLTKSTYTLYYIDAESQVNVMLEIAYNTTYGKISEYLDGIAYSYGGSEILELTDRYAVKHYLEDDSYAILGITGEQNIMYTLVVNSADENADTVELLKEYMEILEL